MALYEWGATIFSLLYLYFAVYNNSICFLFGIVACSIWAYVSLGAHLYFDTALQIFYVVLSIVGLYNWGYGSKTKSALHISDYQPKAHIKYISWGLAISALLIYISKYSDQINLPILDAITTVYMVIGTIMLTARKLSSWIYLVLADIVYIYIYLASDLKILAAMMVVYVIFGSVGWWKWRGMLLSQQLGDPR